MLSFARRLSVFLFSPILLVLALAAAAHAAPVLMISIDGMKPEYITQADAHGMKLPFLRSMMRDGTHAAGRIGREENEKSASPGTGRSSD